MLPVTTLVINVSSVALIWFGGLRIDAGQMQVGSLIAFLSYFMQILMAVLLATFILVIAAAGVGVRRTDHRGAVHQPDDHQPRSSRCRPAASRGAIRLEAATFCYPGADRPVLQDISLTARPGTTTAIVGSHRVGQVDAGVADLPAVRRDRGVGAVDGVDVRDYDTEQLWSTIGVVPQRGYLFSGTVAENLRYGKADASERRDVGGAAGRRRRRFRARARRRAWTCGSRRAASTSPAASGSGWRSPAR